MNITLAVALNYNRSDIAPFLNSFEKNVSGELYLITNNLNILTDGNYSKIKLLDIQDIVNHFNINLQNLTVYNLKPVIFYLTLKKLKEKLSYDKVILTDVDLFFQYDPFTLLDLISTKTFIICEEKKLYSECDTNTTWFNAGYHEIYNDVKDKKILNCGFTLGYTEAVIGYQKQVAHELQKILSYRPYFAYDQVILNVLTYSKKTLTPTILPHGNPYIVHMHHMSAEELVSDFFTDLEILNKDKKPYCVVHQFNEKEQGNNFVQKVWLY